VKSILYASPSGLFAPRPISLKYWHLNVCRVFELIYVTLIIIPLPDKSTGPTVSSPVPTGSTEKRYCNIYMDTQLTFLTLNALIVFSRRAGAVCSIHCKKCLSFISITQTLEEDAVLISIYY